VRRLFRPFLEHPASVNETYPEHLVSAWSFALRLLTAGGACLVHGVFPFLCVRTGSDTIRALHDRMVVNRVRNGSDSPPAAD
jgi:hypothetical protein